MLYQKRIIQLLRKRNILKRMRVLFYFFDSIILKFIKKPRPRKEKKQVIVIFSQALGDIVMFLGVTNYLRDVYPEEEYELTITCSETFRPLVTRKFNYIIPMDYHRVTLDVKYRIHFFKTLKQNHYDILIDPIGTEECGPNVFASNAICAEKKIGVLSGKRKKYPCPQWIRKKIYSDIIEIEDENLHRINYFTKIISEVANSEYQPMIADLCAEIAEHQIQIPYAVIFPSASTGFKRWPVERYVEIAKRLYRVTQYPIVCCGTENDREVTEKLIDSIKEEVDVVNFIGKTDLLGMIDIISKSKLVITNDTSVYHIAIASGRRTCVISGGYSYSKFVNYINQGYELRDRIRIVCHTPTCMNCDNACIYKPNKIYPCVDSIGVEEVWDSIQELL